MISTGNILREAIKDDTPLGQSVKSFVNAGKLVPDDIIVGVISERLGKSDLGGSFLLDGFPRTVAQAEALEDMGIEVDHVLSLEVADSEIERRMSSRRTCLGCGATYHTEFKPPVKDGICDQCGGTVVMRPDDAPETVRARLAIYHEQTEPVKGYYEAAGKLISVPAVGDIGGINQRILELIGVR